MTLYEKIKTLYTELTDEDFMPHGGGTIMLQNDSDGRGDYIKEWHHTLAKPTQEQLDGVQ